MKLNIPQNIFEDYKHEIGTTKKRFRKGEFEEVGNL